MPREIDRLGHAVLEQPESARRNTLHEPALGILHGRLDENATNLCLLDDFVRLEHDTVG